jgi:hypothetical protein
LAVNRHTPEIRLDSHSLLIDNCYIIAGTSSGNLNTIEHRKGAVMKRIALSVTVMFVFAASGAFAAVKPCDELKTEIEAKLKAKGVQGYTLQIVPADQVKDEKVVGSCEGGSKKITYSRGEVKKTEEKEQKK